MKGNSKDFCRCISSKRKTGKGGVTAEFAKGSGDKGHGNGQGI